MSENERAASPSPARERSGLNPNVEAETDDTPTDDTPTDDNKTEDTKTNDAAQPDRSQPNVEHSDVDPLADSPGAGVDDTESPEAVEPNEPG